MILNDSIENNKNEDDEELKKIRAKRLEELKMAFEGSSGGTGGSGDDWPDEPVVLTEQNFDDFVKKYPFIVIDCWAPWCGPCRMVAPAVEELAKEHKGKLVFGKLNTDENQSIAMKYNIMSIPTFLIFKDGELIARPVGAMPKPALESTIMEHMK
jgi:thioredoxin 1